MLGHLHSLDRFSAWVESETGARYDLTTSLWGLVKVLSQGQQTGFCWPSVEEAPLEGGNRVSWRPWKLIFPLL